MSDAGTNHRDLRRDLLAEWLFRGDASDTSGHGLHGEVHGATLVADRFGRPRNAYRFDGDDDYIVIAQPPPLDPRAFSVSVWARYDRMVDEGWSSCIICQDDGYDPDQSRRVFQLSTRDNHFTWHRMTRVRDPMARHRVRRGRWYHVAAVCDGDAHRLYVDGVLNDDTQHMLTTHPEEPIYIGRKGTSEQYFFFNGVIDDIRLYNRAVDAQDVQQLYQEGGYQPTADVSDAPARRGADPISGTWTTPSGDLLVLTYDGQQTVTGRVTGGGPRNPFPIARGSFDRATGALLLEGEARRSVDDPFVPYVIDGVLDGDTLDVRYRFGADEGRATVTRLTAWTQVRRQLRALGSRVRSLLIPVVLPVVRAARDRQRPSPSENARRLRERGEHAGSLVIREPAVQDIPALADLHVKTWSATYPNVRQPPTYAIREWQWRQAFDKQDGSWFCYVIENGDGQLVGFAKGVRNNDGSGSLSKIYLLSEYQRLGLGRRLLGVVTERFLEMGVTSMYVSADPGNPSCGFYEALGAVNTRDSKGRVNHGSYVWRDLKALASICPAPMAGYGSSPEARRPR